MSFDDFDLELDSITSKDDFIPGLLDDEDIRLVRPKSAGNTSPLSYEKEDTDAYNHVTGGGFDPSEFADDGSDIPDDEEDDNPKPKVVPVVKSTGGYKNKMEHAKAIFARETALGHSKRAHFIQLFVNEAGCTPAGASTYYATIKSSQ